MAGERELRSTLGLNMADKVELLAGAVKGGAPYYAKSGDYSVYINVLNLNNNKLAEEWLAGVEHGAIVYCDTVSGKFSYTKIEPGKLPSAEELIDGKAGEMNLQLLLDTAINLLENNKRPLAIIHSHGMLVRSKEEGGAEKDLNPLGDQGLSDPDKRIAEELAGSKIRICAIKSNGGFDCSGGQPN